MRRAALFLLLLVGCASPELASEGDGAREKVRRIASILDYVAGDYALAVQDGQVIDELEYEEQGAFLTEARRIGEELGEERGGSLPELDARLAALLERVEAKASVEEIATGSRALRRDLLEFHQVVLAPSTAPSLAQGSALYGELCAVCHGTSGGGDGLQAPGLVPPPTNFLDEETMLGVSPVRAFNALTDGIEGTSMVSYQHLSVHDRWSLAYFVVGLRHDEEASTRGAKAMEAAGASPSLAFLAEANDDDLVAWLLEAGLEGIEAKDALAHLRLAAPYRISDRPLAKARERLRQAELAYERGEKAIALDAVIAAYLDGFEPVEAVLFTRDAALVGQTETAFLRLRESIARDAPMAAVLDQVEGVQRLLIRAERLLEGASGAGVAFVAAMTIMLREAVESVLLILLLLGLVRRTGLSSDARMVHAGWIGAVLVGVVLWFVAQVSLPMAGASRELLEGIITLVAALVLLYASHFVLARLDSKRRIEGIRRRLEAAGERKRGVILFSLSFMAVFREAFEVVLFLQAILLESSGAGGAVLAGSVTGLGISLLLFVVLRATGRRMNPGHLLTASGALLCGLAVVLAGKGVRALQEAGTIGATWIGIPRIDWLGIYPSVETLGAQLLAIVAIIAIAGFGRRGERTSGEGAPGVEG